MMSESKESSIASDSPDETDQQYSGPFQSIEFSGTAREYFGIWIANLVLTIATVGIYSAWAKVRRVRYFRNNTLVLDNQMGYHATGGQLLIGRIIAVIAIVIYSIAVNSLDPMFATIAILAFFFAFPWLANKSLRFNARMTSWLNIRLNWRGTYWKTMWYFAIFPIIGFASLGLLVPLASKYYYQYYAQAHYLGTSKFDAHPKTSKFYGAFAIAIVVPALLLGIAGIALWLVISSGTTDHVLGNSASHADGEGAIVFGFDLLAAALFVLPILFFMATYFVFQTMCRNILVNSLALGDVAAFNSHVNPIKYLWIGVTNFLAIVASLGLLIPWASIRKYRYLAQCTSARFESDSADIADEALGKLGAFGEEFATLEGFDISI